MSKAKKTKKEPIKKTLPIEWRIPENMPALLADNILVTYVAESRHFLVSLFEVKKPVKFGAKQFKETVESLDSVPAYCLGRFVIPFDKMESLVAALSANLDNAKSNQS